MKIQLIYATIVFIFFTSCTNQEELQKSRRGLTDLGLNYSVEELKNLKSINLANAKDQDLVFLKPLTNLETLYLGKELSSTTVLSSIGKKEKADQVLKRFNFHSSIDGNGLKFITDLDNLRTLYLDLSNCTNEHLVHLKQLSGLKILGLRYTQIRDEGLKIVGELSQLEELYLDQCHITSKGISYLKGLKKLKILSLFAIQTINDDVAPFLNELKSLEYLDLQLTSITDATLKQLNDFNNLKKMTLWGARVTGDGMMKFVERHPNCIITFERD